jgi:hypothetical protein
VERETVLNSLNSKLQPGATPYKFPERAAAMTASATVDTTAILLEELGKLGEPMPNEIAAHGSSRIADDVARVLEERGQSRYSGEQWRSALREVFRRLTDSKGDTSRRSPNLANVAGMDIHTRATTILAQRGIYDPDADAYVTACEEARAELEPDEGDAQAAYAGSDSGDELHLVAMKVLRARGLDWEHDASQYADAVKEAARILSINLNGRS